MQMIDMCEKRVELSELQSLGDHQVSDVQPQQRAVLKLCESLKVWVGLVWPEEGE